MLSTKSSTHSACGARMPTAHIEISNGLSSQRPASVRNSATSQKYRKLVGP